MKIDSYSFGRIIIDGKTYTSDVIIYPERVDASWWRKEGHQLRFEDLTEALREKPSVLIIGTGYMGVMRVPKETIDRVAGLRIDVRVERTGKAVDLYNEIAGSGNIMAALHITC